jgi:hypothetical protein
MPISTYGGQGVTKTGTLKWQHAIAHTSRDAPDPHPKEIPVDGEWGMMTPIRVAPKKKDGKLDVMSRINFARIYTVEDNVKVYDFGDVHRDSLADLKRQWMFVIKRNVNREIDESDENDEDEDEEEEEDSSEEEDDDDDDDDDDDGNGT